VLKNAIDWVAPGRSARPLPSQRQMRDHAAAASRMAVGVGCLGLRSDHRVRVHVWEKEQLAAADRDCSPRQAPPDGPAIDRHAVAAPKG